MGLASSSLARATKLGKKMNTNNLENMIRDKLTDDDLISGLIEQDDVFEHLIDLIGETIDEWDQTERKWKSETGQPLRLSKEAVPESTTTGTGT